MQDYFKHIKELRKEHGVVSPRKAALASSDIASTASSKSSLSGSNALASKPTKSVSFAPSVGIKVGSGAATGFSFDGASVSTPGGDGGAAS